MREFGRLLLGICGAAALVTAAHADGVDKVRRDELRHLILHDCGSCHGMRLTGGLGPALTPDALRDRPETVITSTVLQGRAGTAMPGWQPLLSEADAEWIAAALKKGILNAH